MRSRQLGGWYAAAILAVSSIACANPERPTGTDVRAMDHATMTSNAANPNAAAGDTKGFINGWLDGEEVDLRYTRQYFCAEPPTSGVETDCEVGAAGEVAPRSGPIPKIYALAPAGFQPAPATLHCKGGILCLNHPVMLDVSRLGLVASVTKPAHSHILASRQAGGHNTVNIRVPSLEA